MFSTFSQIFLSPQKEIRGKELSGHLLRGKHTKSHALVYCRENLAAIIRVLVENGGVCPSVSEKGTRGVVRAIFRREGVDTPKHAHGPSASFPEIVRRGTLHCGHPNTCSRVGIWVHWGHHALRCCTAQKRDRHPARRQPWHLLGSETMHHHRTLRELHDEDLA